MANTVRAIQFSDVQRNHAARAFDRERQRFLTALATFARSRGVDQHDVYTEIAATTRAMDGILATCDAR